MQRNNLLIAVALFLMVAGVLFFFSTGEEKDDQGIDSVIVNTQAIHERTPELEVSLEFPVIEGMPDGKMQERLNQDFSGQLLARKEEMKREAEEGAAQAEQAGFPFITYEFISSYTVTLNRGGLLSLYTDVYEYMGGAHGITIRIPHNIRLGDGTGLQLADLFKPGYDYQEVINRAINEKIARDPGLYFTGEMGFTGISSDQEYYLRDDGVVVHFGLYEIAPYAAGFQEFFFSYDLLGEGLQPWLLNLTSVAGITYDGGKMMNKITITTARGPIVLEIYPEKMPITVDNFDKLVKAGFYDGLSFHRVEDWVVQGGDPKGNGTGGPGWTIPLETSPELNNVRGAVAMARSMHPDSAGSQFYILKKDASWLDGQYAVFGKVTEGMEVVDQLQIGDKMETVK